MEDFIGSNVIQSFRLQASAVPDISRCMRWTKYFAKRSDQIASTFILARRVEDDPTQGMNATRQKYRMGTLLSLFSQ